MKARIGTAWIALALAAWVHAPASAQGSRLPGATEAGLLLRQADGVKRVLLVAAHPDDEDTELLATLARGWGAEAAYFSFTRGEGGQNLIGPELGEGLGILRSGELLAARSVDGAEQMFGRAYDFGYSKSAEETFRAWPREAVLSDLVWAIRAFRPQVIVSMWSGTERDGHGHHQASGMLTLEAWEAAGDPSRFPEQVRDGLAPWTPSKLYRRTFFDPEAAHLSIPTGRLDPLLGRSHHQVAMESRSRHRSQDFGTVQSPGPRTTDLALMASRVSAGAGEGLLAGIDTTLASLARPSGATVLAEIGSYRSALHEARDSLNVLEPERALAPLAGALASLDRALADLDDDGERGELRRELERRREALGRAALAVSGVRVETRARDDVLVPGQTILVEVRVWSGAAADVRLAAPHLETPPGWTALAIGPDAEVPPDDTGPFGRFFRREEPVAEPGGDVRLGPGEIRLWRYRVTVPAGAGTRSPYYLEEPRDGAIYRLDEDPRTRTRPFRPSPVTAAAHLFVGAAGSTVELSVREPVRYRGVSGDAGEFWRPVQVAPRVSVGAAPAMLVWPLDDPTPRDLTFRLASRDPEALSGTLSLDPPAGWRVEPASRAFDLPGDGAETALSFTLTPGGTGTGGELVVRPALSLDGRPAEALSVDLIAYPHIEPRLYTTPASVRIVRLPLQVADRRVGYVMGSGDEGPDAIRRLGLEVELIGPVDWSAERLERYDTIVLGVRAYEVRRDLIAANPTLLDWVGRGGTLVVQYHRYEFNEGSYAPYPITIGSPAPRVTDETAAVTLEDEASPLLTAPNDIAAADFEGWVQERGLYFPTAWDERYDAPLSMADPGEPGRAGSLLAAPYGEGLYVHTSLSFFRQLPAGVPGAYRLFANLISLDGRSWRAAKTAS